MLLCVSIECYLGAKRLVQKQNNQSLLMCNRLISCEHACVCVHALYCVKGFRSYHLKSFDCELCHCTCQIVESHLERDGGGGGGYKQGNNLLMNYSIMNFSIMYSYICPNGQNPFKHHLMEQFKRVSLERFIIIIVRNATLQTLLTLCRTELI